MAYILKQGMRIRTFSDTVCKGGFIALVKRPYNEKAIP